MVWVLVVVGRLFQSVALDSAGYIFQPQGVVWELRDYMSRAPQVISVNL